MTLHFAFLLSVYFLNKSAFVVEALDNLIHESEWCSNGVKLMQGNLLQKINTKQVHKKVQGNKNTLVVQAHLTLFTCSSFGLHSHHTQTKKNRV